MTDSATHPKEEKMKQLPQVLFWLGLISIPFAWLVWYVGPQMEMVRPVLASISDPALRAALQEAHAERLGLWVAVWPVTLLVLSQILETKVQERETTFAVSKVCLSHCGLCPLYPQKRTLELSRAMSALCQKRTSDWAKPAVDIQQGECRWPLGAK